MHHHPPSITPRQEEPESVESPVIAEVNATHSQEQDSSSSEEEDGEASGSAAFNPVTGEINWDCPCLGGMAHGVCGPQFREAFSCFVFSEKEPKGIDCVEKFKGMQDCFREHPDIYGAEIMDDDEEEESAASITEGADEGTAAANAATREAEPSS